MSDVLGCFEGVWIENFSTRWENKTLKIEFNK